jgi:dihydrofolate reductase
MRKPLAIIVCVARRGVIGKDGGLPWRIKEDLQYFKTVTMDHAIIMGRKTHDSIGRALPGRRNIVVGRQLRLQIPGCEVEPTFEDGLRLAYENDEEPRVIGGATIYELALPLATKIFLTEVDRDVEGDTFFPTFDRSAWAETSRRPSTEHPDVSFVTLER